MSTRLSIAALLAFAACAGAPPRPPAPPPTCGNVASWRAWSIDRATGPARAALERWQPPGPVAFADRPAVQDVVRAYFAQCAAEEVTALTTQLVAFPTVGEQEKAATSKAFADMAAFLKQGAEANGLAFNTYGQNGAWEISLGNGPAGVGFVMHADVVPAATQVAPELASSKAAKNPKASSLPAGWTHHPFITERVGDRLYGRGTEDDKGPIAAVLVTMSTLQKFGVPPLTKMVAILGTGEESDWDPMIAYAKDTPHPKYVISVDSNFPVVVAENGFVAWHLASTGKAGRAIRCAEVLDANGGEFLTQIPGTASARLRAGGSESPDAFFARVQLAAQQEQASRGNGFTVDAFKLGDSVQIRTKGKAAHSSLPEEGANALWPLAAVVMKVGPCDGGAGTLLRILAEKFDGDHYGANLGLAHADPLMGPLVVAPTLLRVENGIAKLSVNMREPRGFNHDQLVKRLDDATLALTRQYGITEVVADRFVGDPHIADTTGPLVGALLDIYRSATGDGAAVPISTRGGTYARLFPGAVSFGPSLPKAPYAGHSPDEFIDVPNLALQAKVILEAAIKVDAMAASRAYAPPK